MSKTLAKTSLQEDMDEIFGSSRPPVPVNSAAVRRVTSTLTPDPRFVLPPKDRKQGFLYLYYNLTKARKTYWSWMALTAAALFPGKPQAEITMAKERDLKQIFSKQHNKAWSELQASKLTRIFKDETNGTFRVRVPLFVFKLNSGSSIAFEGSLVSATMALDANAAFPGYLEEPSIRDAAYSEAKQRINAGQATINFEEETLTIPGKSSLHPLDIKAFRDCRAEFKVSPLGLDHHVSWLEASISREQAEFLTNTPWVSIRPIDIYGPVFEWVDSQYGRLRKSPTFSLSLSSIASSIRGVTPSVRSGEDGILVDEHARMFWLPKDLSDINRFEDAMNAAYRQPDGWFTAIPDDGNLRTPPPSMPVLVDWVNLKFSYTTLDGRLRIKNLDRTYVATPTHHVRFLKRKLTDDRVANFISLVLRLGDFYKVLAENLVVIPSLKSELSTQAARRGEGSEEGDISLVDIHNYSRPGQTEDGRAIDPSVFCQRFINVCRAVLERIENSPETAYGRYSVTTVIELRAELVSFVKYGPEFDNLKKQDLQRRDAYLTQGEDPNYTLEAVPYVQASLGLMPHQAKVANVTRKRPDNIFYPIDAGGGKTIVAAYDVLREMRHGETGPFVIMCPSHLVGQYVKELVYVTEGRLNCIPITTYTIRRQGLDRLQAMVTNAPVNTVIVVDYNVIELGKRSISYGVESVSVYPVIEFIRQFAPEYVFCDEAHYLRNESSRQAAVNRLIADVPKKRMASGTLVANTLIDLCRQMALMDPTVFGTTDDFVSEFALETRGGKVLAWKPGAELEVRRAMRENAVLAEARRKEWAAILPYPKERFISADLTPAQQEVYKQILNQVIEELEKKMEENESLRRLFNPGAKSTEPSEDGDNDSDSEDSVEDESTNIDTLLKPFLARLERFLTAPASDPLGNLLLQGPDRVSAKALKAVEICKEHLDQNLPGKILIFTSYEMTAQAVYDAFPPELQSKVVYYTASKKEECGAEFENNNEKQIMVGIEFSMNTGLNLQFCSRLIRMESVWTPGALEQGSSRIGRPNLKVQESRPFVYFDTIAANRTIDVTKTSYLMAKTISKAKFDEAGNPRFDELEVPPLLSMNLETIAETNDFNESLRSYFDKYAAYKQALFAEYEEYRVKNKDKLFTPEGKLKLVKVERSENMPGSKLMLRVPYVPGMELYSSDKLGLVRYDAFMRLNLEEDEEEESDEVDGDDSDTENEADSSLAAERQAALGMAVHTDRGDGTIVRVNKATLGVELPSGERIKVRKMAAFIITRAETSSKDIRTQLLKMTGDVPLDAPVDVLETKLTDRKKRQLEREAIRKTKEKSEQPVEIELEFTVVNDFLGLRVTNVEEDERIAPAMQAIGFKFSQPYYAAHIPTAQHLLKLAQRWSEEEFELDKENSAWLRSLYMHMKSSKKATVNYFGFANAQQIRNFYRQEFKPNPNPLHINPYPLIQDNEVYVALPHRGQPGSRNSITKCRVPGVKWFEYEEGSELLAFTSSKERASKVMHMLLERGFVIRNINDLKKKFAKLRIQHDTE